MSEPFKVDIHFGWIEIDTRFVPCEQGLKGQGRRRTYDTDGNLTGISEWTDTGCVMTFPGEESWLSRALEFDIAAWLKAKLR